MLLSILFKMLLINLSQLSFMLRYVSALTSQAYQYNWLCRSMRKETALWKAQTTSASKPGPLWRPRDAPVW